MIDHTHHRSKVILVAALLSALLGACHKTPVDQSGTAATNQPAGTLTAPNKADTGSSYGNNSVPNPNNSERATPSSNAASGNSGTAGNTSGAAGASTDNKGQ